MTATGEEMNHSRSVILFVAMATNVARLLSLIKI
jgi:hypothetical protein